MSPEPASNTDNGNGARQRFRGVVLQQGFGQLTLSNIAKGSKMKIREKISEYFSEDLVGLPLGEVGPAIWEDLSG